MDKKELKKQQKKRKYQQELGARIYTSGEGAWITMDTILTEGPPEKLWVGRHLIKSKIRIVDGVRTNVPVYKKTTTEIELKTGFRYKISSFLATELKRRHKLKVYYFNKW
jgi:hypothetical protein